MNKLSAQKSCKRRKGVHLAKNTVSTDIFRSLAPPSYSPSGICVKKPFRRLPRSPIRLRVYRRSSPLSPVRRRTFCIPLRCFFKYSPLPAASTECIIYGKELVNLHIAAWLLPAVILIILILLFFAAGRLMDKVTARRKQHFFTDQAIENTPWADRIPRFHEDQVWMDRQAWEDLWITSYDGLRLHAALLPAAEPSRRTFLAFHGYLSSGRNDFSFAVPLLHARGYNVVLADDRAHGMSEGERITLGLKERFDCRDWVTQLTDRFGPDTSLFLGGMSMGATMVLMAAGLSLPDTVRGIVADCGFDSPLRMCLLVLRRKYGPLAYPLVCAASLLHRITAGFSLHAMTTVRAMAVSSIPVLFVHGDADNYVPPEMTLRAYRACRAEKTLFLGKGAGHTLSWITSTRDYTDAFFDFLDRH